MHRSGETHCDDDSNGWNSPKRGVLRASILSTVTMTVAAPQERMACVTEVAMVSNLVRNSKLVASSVGVLSLRLIPKKPGE